LAAEYAGEQHEALRALAKATWRFVQPRVHDRTEDPTNAMIAADATIHLVNVLTALFPTPTGRERTSESGDDEADDDEDEEWAPGAEDFAYFMRWTAEDAEDEVWEP
jgi:hypothetical protein